MGIREDNMKGKEGLKRGSERVEVKRRERDGIRRTKQGRRGSKDNREKSRLGSWKVENGS